MKILMEILKGIFFFMTAVLALLILRWTTVFPQEIIDKLSMVAMPGYLLLCGIMIGYILWLMRLAHEESIYSSEIVYKQTFLIGVWIGLFFALLYIFVA
jgi:hypothetical protein